MRLKPFIFGLCCCLAYLEARAGEVVIPKVGVSLTIPDGWSGRGVDPQPRFEIVPPDELLGAYKNKRLVVHISGYQQGDLGDALREGIKEVTERSPKSSAAECHFLGSVPVKTASGMIGLKGSFGGRNRVNGEEAGEIVHTINKYFFRNEAGTIFCVCAFVSGDDVLADQFEKIILDTLKCVPVPKLKAQSSNGQPIPKTGNYEEEVAAYTRELIAHPGDVALLTRLGTLQLVFRKLPEAEATLERALSIDPNYGAAHSTLGCVMSQQGYSTEALKHLDLAIEADPTNADFHLNRAVILATGNPPNKPGAREAYKRAIRLGSAPDPELEKHIKSEEAGEAKDQREQIKSLFTESQALYESRDYNEAFMRCEQILGIDPYNIAARKQQEKINSAISAAIETNPQKKAREDELMHPTLPPQYLGMPPSSGISK